MDMENKKSRRILFRTLLAVGTLLSSQQVFAYGCAYKEGNINDATITGIYNRDIYIYIGADAFDDNTADTLYSLGEHSMRGMVTVNCHQGNLPRYDPRYKKQGYTNSGLDLAPGTNELDRIYQTEYPGIGFVAALTNDADQVDLTDRRSRLMTYAKFPPEDLQKTQYTINGKMAMAVKIYDVNALPAAGSYTINLSRFKAKMVYGANWDGTDSQGNNDDDGGDDNYDAKITSLFNPGTATITLVNSSCDLLTQSIQVDLGEISPAEIRPVSPKLANFNIELANCPREVNVDYKFVNNNVAPLDSSILMLDDEPGGAEGVGIQISHNNNDGMFYPLHLNHPEGAGATGYTVAAYAVPDWPNALRNVTIPLKARYRRLHDHIPVTGGKVKATAHFEVHYH